MRLAFADPCLLPVLRQCGRRFSDTPVFPPHPAWTELARLFVLRFSESGTEPMVHRLYRILRARGLGTVNNRPFLVGVRTHDPWQDYLPAMIEFMRGTITGRLGIDEKRANRKFLA
jgi:hypothetical protein